MSSRTQTLAAEDTEVLLIGLGLGNTPKQVQARTWLMYRGKELAVHLKVRRALLADLLRPHSIAAIFWPGQVWARSSVIVPRQTPEPGCHRKWNKQLRDVYIYIAIRIFQKILI